MQLALETRFGFRINACGVNINTSPNGACVIFIINKVIHVADLDISIFARRYKRIDMAVDCLLRFARACSMVSPHELQTGTSGTVTPNTLPFS